VLLIVPLKESDAKSNFIACKKAVRPAKIF